jgi:hypothetical protein
MLISMLKREKVTVFNLKSVSQMLNKKFEFNGSACNIR